MLSSRSLTLLGLAVVALAGCDRHSSAPPQPSATFRSQPVFTEQKTAEPAGAIDRSHKGAPPPDYTVRDRAGAALALRSLKGTPVLVNLWATWCAPCVAELPTLDALAAKGGVQVVTISQDMKPAGVPAFLKAKGGPHLPAWLDPDGELSARYPARTLPTSILYDARGREVWRWEGGNAWGSAAAAKLLAEATAAR